MNTILVPTDFSENANNALEYAAKIADTYQASIVLLHVYTPMVSRINAVGALLTDEVADARKNAMEKLTIIKITLESEFTGITCTPEVTVGEPVTEILRQATVASIDLIVMGTLGASNLTKSLFGSNTAAVVEKSSCPVLCVPARCSFKKPERILFATNFSYDDTEGIVKLSRLARAFKSRIIVGHVDTSVTSDEDEGLENSMQNFIKEAERKSQYGNFDYKIVEDHNVSMGLDAIIQENQIDMVALSTHKRNFFEKFYNPSLSKKLSLYTDIPLVVFQNPPDQEKTGTDF